ncbi:MAG: HAD family phosphatase [Butyrivibrio sp.]|nr:HAD family phosphatase [Butyrivibrio sp.]
MINIVFDMDGVLFDTQKIYCKAWEEAAGVLGIPDIGEPLRRCIGMNRNDQEAILKDFYHDSFPYDDFYREKDKAFDAILSKGVPLMKGTREILEFLKEKGARVAIASSSRVGMVEDNLKNTGLTGFFDKIVGGNLVTHSKPNPEIYLKACELLGVKPEESYAVEDSYNGIRAASAAGMRVIMVPDMQPPTEETDALIYKKFDSLLDFKDWIDNESPIRR